MKCPECNAEVKVGWVACPECGVELTWTTECTNCGEDLKLEWTVCPACGEPVEDDEEEEEEEMDVDDEEEEEEEEEIDEEEAAALAEDAVIDALLDALREHEDADGFYMIPSIPEKKLKNAQAKCDVPEDEAIVALIDTTVMGSAKNCVLIGSSGIWYHNDWSAEQSGANVIPYDDFVDRHIAPEDSNEVSLGGEDKIDVSGCLMSSEAVTLLLRDVQQALSD